MQGAFNGRLGAFPTTRRLLASFLNSNLQPHGLGVSIDLYAGAKRKLILCRRTANLSRGAAHLRHCSRITPEHSPFQQEQGCPCTG